jgi:hypothetical protein
MCTGKLGVTPTHTRKNPYPLTPFKLTGCAGGGGGAGAGNVRVCTNVCVSRVSNTEQLPDLLSKVLDRARVYIVVLSPQSIL